MRQPGTAALAQLSRPIEQMVVVGSARAQAAGRTLILVVGAQGDAHVADGFRAAWFTDPDGSIVHITNM